MRGWLQCSLAGGWFVHATWLGSDLRVRNIAGWADEARKPNNPARLRIITEQIPIEKAGRLERPAFQ